MTVSEFAFAKFSRSAASRFHHRRCWPPTDRTRLVPFFLIILESADLWSGSIALAGCCRGFVLNPERTCPSVAAGRSPPMTMIRLVALVLCCSLGLAEQALFAQAVTPPHAPEIHAALLSGGE